MVMSAVTVTLLIIYSNGSQPRGTVVLWVKCFVLCEERNNVDLLYCKSLIADAL